MNDQIKAKLLRYVIDTDGKLPNEYASKLFNSEVNSGWFHDYQPKEDLFIKDNAYALLYDFCKEYYDNFVSVPSDDTILMELDSKSNLNLFKKNEITEAVNAIRQFDSKQNDFDYLRDELKKIHVGQQGLHLARRYTERLKEDPLGAVEYMQTQMAELASRVSTRQGLDSETVWLPHLVQEYRERLINGQGFAKGIVPFPFSQWNNVLGGMKRGEVWVFAAKHNVGKSFLGHEIAYSVAESAMTTEGAEEDGPVVCAELEMLYDQIVLRYAARITNLPMKKIELEQLTDDEKVLLDETLSEISNATATGRLLFIPGSKCQTPAMLRREIEHKLGSKKPKLVLVDYLTKMRSSRKNLSGWEGVADVADELKDLAMYFECPLITMIHLNKRDEVQYQSIDQKLDVVLTMNMSEDRPYVSPNTEDGNWVGEPGIIECFVERNRSGPKGVTLQVEVEFATATVRQVGLGVARNPISASVMGRGYSDELED
jgi:replicative DNA helicase